MSKKLFCLDTCALTWAMRDAYPKSIVPTFWDKMTKAHMDGLIISNEMILREIERQDDDLHQWCKSVPDLFLKVDQQLMNGMAGIVRSYPKVVDPKKDKDGADPFLIAQAQVTGAIIVTQEKPAGSQAKKMKIPDVASAMDLGYINMLQFVKEMGWVFR